MMKNAIAILLLAGLASCSFFGEKNKVGDYIEKPDYSLKSVEYVPVLPYFAEGLKVVSLYSGYDELLYVVDSAKAIYSYDAAGRQLGRYDLPNVYFVIQNRSLDLYALARVDTIINGLSYNLPAIYKISQKEFTDGGNTTLLNLNLAEIERKLLACSSSITPIVGTTALEETTNINIYPNPVSEELNIQADNIESISLSNLLGQELIRNENINTNFHTILTTKLAPAVYIITVVNNGKISVKQFVKK